jgi:hypothetical protein
MPTQFPIASSADCSASKRHQPRPTRFDFAQEWAPVHRGLVGPPSAIFGVCGEALYASAIPKSKRAARPNAALPRSSGGREPLVCPQTSLVSLSRRTAISKRSCWSSVRFTYCTGSSKQRTCGRPINRAETVACGCYKNLCITPVTMKKLREQGIHCRPRDSSGFVTFALCQQLFTISCLISGLALWWVRA